MNETRSRIAFLGIGLMGSPQARNILKAGFALTAWNRSAAKADALVQFGAGVAATPADAARTADVVILMLENGPIVERVLFGSDMVVAMRPGTCTRRLSASAPDSRSADDKVPATAAASPVISSSSAQCCWAEVAA